jgi:hypothetical protein
MFSIALSEEHKDTVLPIGSVSYYPKFFNFEGSFDYEEFAEFTDRNIALSRNGFELFLNASSSQRLVDPQKDMFLGHAFQQTMDIVASKIVSNVDEQPTQNWNTDSFIFASMNSFGVTKLHNDDQFVALTSLHGATVYNVIISETNQKIPFLVGCGDLLCIPSRVYHNAIPCGPRISLSIGVFPKEIDPESIRTDVED